VTLEAIDVTHDERVINGGSVQMKLAKDLPLVQGDRVQLLQVLVNLIMSPHAAGARDLLDPRRQTQVRQRARRRV
jgi:C4-dicarboxylate-specific signal transduction histidine kinase